MFLRVALKYLHLHTKRKRTLFTVNFLELLVEFTIIFHFYLQSHDFHNFPKIKIRKAIACFYARFKVSDNRLSTLGQINSFEQYHTLLYYKVPL